MKLDQCGARFRDALVRPGRVVKLLNCARRLLGLHNTEKRHCNFAINVLFRENLANRRLTTVKVKVKFSHTRYRALGPELIPVYRQSARRWREVNHAIYPAVVCRCFLPDLRSSYQMALPVNGNTHLIPAYYSFYRPRQDERLSWPSWLTCSGWLTHISGHPSAAGRA